MTNRCGAAFPSLLSAAVLVAVQATVCSLSFAAVDLSTAYPLVPWPMRLAPLPGTFLLTRETAIVADAAGEATARYLAEALRPLLGAAPAVRTADAALAPKPIVLRIDPALKSLGAEGYDLEITPDRLEMRAADSGGTVLRLPDVPATSLAVGRRGGERRRDGSRAPLCLGRAMRHASKTSRVLPGGACCWIPPAASSTSTWSNATSTCWPRTR